MRRNGRMRGRAILAPLLAAAALLAAGSARAQQSRVLVLGSNGTPPRPGFVEALRIQLVGRAAVEAGAALDELTLGDRSDEAAQIVESRGASAAVWMEPVPAP